MFATLFVEIGQNLIGSIAMMETLEMEMVVVSYVIMKQDLLVKEHFIIGKMIALKFVEMEEILDTSFVMTETILMETVVVQIVN